MANTIPTTYMNLPNPVPGVDPGPDWASNLYSSLVIIDQHDHSPGSGQQITPSGININSDLAFQSSNATLLRSVRFSPQVSPITGASPDLGCLYEAGVDLYFNDGSGNQIRITQSGSVAGASGTITGLPSGTAGASFSSGSGTFVWEQATSTGANMDAATYILRYPGSYPTPAGNFISLQAPASLATGFAFTFPNNTPASNQSALVSDTSGTLSYMTPDNIGAAMTATGANAIADSRTRATGTTVGAGGVAVSTSSGNFFTGSTALNIINCTITTTGRPVSLSLQWDGASTFGSFVTLNNGNDYVQFQRSGTIVSKQGFGGGGAAPSSSFNVVDFPAAGTYTYQLDLIGTGGNQVGFVVLVVYEL